MLSSIGCTNKDVDEYLIGGDSSNSLNFSFFISNIEAITRCPFKSEYSPKVFNPIECSVEEVETVGWYWTCSTPKASLKDRTFPHTNTLTTNPTITDVGQSQ